MCKQQWLSLQGRITIVKTLSLSLIQFPANCIEVPDYYVKTLNKLNYQFIWGGPDKIKRARLALDKPSGGLKVPELSDILTAAKAMWLKRRAVTGQRD